MDIDLLNAINTLARFTQKQIVQGLHDGDPVPSNPMLQHKRDALRKRVQELASRLLYACDEAERENRLMPFTRHYTYFKDNVASFRWLVSWTFVVKYGKWSEEW